MKYKVVSLTIIFIIFCMIIGLPSLPKSQGFGFIQGVASASYGGTQVTCQFLGGVSDNDFLLLIVQWVAVHNPPWVLSVNEGAGFTWTQILTLASPANYSAYYAYANFAGYTDTQVNMVGAGACAELDLTSDVGIAGAYAADTVQYTGSWANAYINGGISWVTNKFVVASLLSNTGTNVNTQIVNPAGFSSPFCSGPGGACGQTQSMESVTWDVTSGSSSNNFYTTSSYFMTISNIGAIVLANNPLFTTTTLTVTAWNAIDTGTPSTWIVMSLFLFFIPSIFLGFALRGNSSKGIPNRIVFITLVSLFIASALGAAAGIELGANAVVPLAIVVFNGISLGIFVIRSQGRTMEG